MEQRRYTTQYIVPNPGEAWNSDTGSKADNTAPVTILSPDDPYYELAIGKIVQVENND